MAEPLQTFLPRLRKHPGRYVPRVSYITVCAFIDGYALASDEQIGAFHRWLVGHGAPRPEHGWPWLVLAQSYAPDALPDPRGVTSVCGDPSAGLVGDGHLRTLS